jgi:hypothetical protein
MVGGSHAAWDGMACRGAHELSGVLCGVPCLPAWHGVLLCAAGVSPCTQATSNRQFELNCLRTCPLWPALASSHRDRITTTFQSSTNSLQRLHTTTMLSQKSYQRLTSPHRLMTANLSPSRTAAAPQERARGRVAVSAAASSPQLPQPIAEPLAFTKALVTVAVRHLTESALDAAADLSIALAEQPRRMREFADEVQAAAVLELQNSGQQQPQRLLSSTSSASSGQNDSSGSGGAGSMSSAAGRPDLEALVDDLRADIAASRALLQQIRAGTPPGSQPGTQSTRRSR